MTDTNAIKLSPTARHLARQEAENILNESEGVSAVVVATVDGFDIASVIRSDLDPSRIAAMASSISAIAYVVSDEAKLGRGKRVTIETDAGFAVVCSIPRSDTEMVLIVIADGRALLGQVAFRSAAAVSLMLNAA